MIKLLIDECLSGDLALMARERGHHEASHVVWIGKSGWKDWELKKLLVEGNWTLVTKNSEDFRGPRDARGTRGQLASVPLHAGLICLNGPVGMNLPIQKVLFAHALDELSNLPELVNQVLEISLINGDSVIEVSRYEMPRS